MKKYFKLLFCTCLLGVVASSCSNDDEAINVDKYMPITNVVAGPQDLQVIAGGDWVSINVDAKGAWTATTDVEWAKVETSEGNGTALLKVNVDANDTYSDRVATVKVTSAGKTDVITITQAAEYYAASQIETRVLFPTSNSVWFEPMASENVARMRICHILTRVLEDKKMSVSDKLNYVINNGSTVSYTKDFWVHRNLDPNEEYTMLTVAFDEQNRPGKPAEITFKTLEAYNMVDSLAFDSVMVDESNWYVKSGVKDIPGFYLVTVTENSPVYSLLSSLSNKNATDVDDMALYVYEMAKLDVKYEGVECVYVPAGEVAQIERKRVDMTEDADALYFITLVANEDFSLISTRFANRLILSKKVKHIDK